VKSLIYIFGSVLLAELGDKTQIATMLYATNQSVRPPGVFVAASSALVLSTLLAVVFGSVITDSSLPQPETDRRNYFHCSRDLDDRIPIGLRVTPIFG
jgi:putative Ca2+/H+ antiporter (TMEM165/GDT1 family)